MTNLVCKKCGAQVFRLIPFKTPLLRRKTASIYCGLCDTYMGFSDEIEWKKIEDVNWKDVGS